jgi:radical SAM protein with 4Fe4S-binding SPASM domain
LYRRGGNFSEILEGVKSVIRARGGKLRPLISLQFLLLRHNVAEIKSFQELAISIGAERILFKTAQVSSSAEADSYLPAEAKYSRYIDASSLKLKRKRLSCRRLLYSAVIDWNGNVIPCCFDKGEDFVMGNAFENSFGRVWRSEKFEQFRYCILHGERPAMCSNCTEGLEKLFI